MKRSLMHSSEFYGMDLLLDQDGNGVRAEFFRTVFHKHAVYALDYHSLIFVDVKKVMEWPLQGGYKPYHNRASSYRDGDRSDQSYFSHDGTKSTLIIVRKNMENPSQAPPAAFTSGEYYDEDDDYGGHVYDTNGNTDSLNRVSYIGIQTDSEEERDRFRKFIEANIKVVETKNRLYMLKANDYDGVELDSFPMGKEVGKNFDLNYGSSFKKVHERVVECLSKKKSGLYVLHGPPGTGKTSYIKYLTTVVEDRKFIFIPNNLIGNIFSPKMVQTLYKFKNAVLVLEDAELCVFKRDGTNNELVSGILNITDGLLKDLLNISIFVTFNATEIEEIDKALLRKGRMHVIYRFDLLNVDDARALLRAIGKDRPVSRPMSLADIYNIDEELDPSGTAVKLDDKAPGFAGLIKR